MQRSQVYVALSKGTLGKQGEFFAVRPFDSGEPEAGALDGGETPLWPPFAKVTPLLLASFHASCSKVEYSDHTDLQEYKVLTTKHFRPIHQEANG